MGLTVPPMPPELRTQLAYAQVQRRKEAAAAIAFDPWERWVLEGGDTLYSEFLLEDARWAVGEDGSCGPKAPHSGPPNIPPLSLHEIR